MFKLFKYLRKRDWFYALIVVGLVVCQVWLDLTMPDYTSALTTLVSNGSVTMSDVWYNGGMMLLCALGSLACSIIAGYFAALVASSLSREVRGRLFNKITSFSSVEMGKFSTSSLITRTTNDITQIQNFVAMGLQLLIKAPILAIWAICKISSASVEWTLATVICVAVIVVAVGTIVLCCIKKFNRVQKLTDNLNTATRESVSGVRVVRAFNAEEYQEAKFEKANGELTKNQLFTSRTMGFLSPVISLCMNGLTLAIYWIGAYLVNAAETIERANIVGNMTAFTQYALQVVMAFMLLVMIFTFMPRAMVSAKRVNEVLDTEISIKPGEVVEGNGQGEIVFDNVSFKYQNGTNSTLTNISFTIHKGETVAFVGATGSGKSTLIDLIPRFNEVTEGRVLVDGVDVRDYDKETLQDKIAMVSQKAVLFKGDIKSNITYGYNDPVDDDDPRIERALSVAEADFVKNLDEGIHAPVAQGGTNFSGGQKQRLSIARAVFKDSEIIIFDDSFSALDYKTDQKVRHNLRDKLSDKTVLIIAQRIGTIMNADNIIVLDDGKIVGQGKHKDLLENCPLYKEIALSQLSKEEL